MPITSVLMDDFRKGMMRQGMNRINFATDAVRDGLNVELADGGCRSRSGSSVMSTGSLPAGEVMALTQFRSPTNEQSYVVAQVESLRARVALYQGSVGGSGPALVWDTANGVALVFGSTDVYSWEPITDTWETLTITGTPPDARSLTTAIYVPALESAVMFGGWYWDGADNYLNDVWVLDRTAGTWTEQATTGDVPDPGVYLSVYRSATNSMIVFKDAQYYYELSLTTWVWTEQATTISGAGAFPNDNNNSTAVAYDSDTDTLVIAGGTAYGEVEVDTTWILSLTTYVWTQRADMLNAEANSAGYLGFYCSGVFYIIGSINETTFPLGVYAFTIATNTWAQLTSLGTAPNGGVPTVGCVTDYGTILFLVGTRIYETESYCTLDSYLRGWGLYACDDHLPTTTGVFELIYEFTSEPGVCTFGPLNDRLVITEGQAAVPLVWGGCRSVDGSDWIHLLHCLIAQDGIRFYDISAEVCDKDVDTIAQVGGIRKWGWLAFCTDMPTASGFYIEMETPNTGSDGTTTSTFYEPITVDDAADVERQNLNATIVNWVQSAGATGHFTDGGAATVTLGPGNTNEDVIPGILVKFADAEVIITAIVGDGSGVDSVTLSAAHVTAAVDAIYGTTVDTTGLSVIYQTDAATTTWSKTMGNYPATMAGYSLRIVIPAADISTSGDHVQLTLQAAKGVFAYAPTAVGFGATHVSIVERSGSTDDGTTTPTEVTFNGGESGCAASTLAGEITSDSVPFAIDETKDYLVIVDVTWATYHDTGGNNQGVERRAGFVANVAGGTSYTKEAGFGLAEESWNDQTVTGFTAQSKTFLVNKIEVATLEAVPDSGYVAHTTDGIQILTGAWESISGIDIDAVTPGASLLYLAVSFDARATFWVFDASAWRQIVRESGGNWQYNDSATATPNWVNAAVDSLLGALREAFGVAQNQMTKAEFEAITEAEWQSTDGFIPHVTTSFDLACSMAADGTDVPKLSGFTIQYTDGGQNIFQVYKNGAWTDVPGNWTDGTIADGNRLGQTGIIGGTTEETADYHVLDGVPGFWWRMLTNGTSPDCAITRIRYKAPCQALSNIGDGQPDISTGVVFVDTSTGATHDCSDDVANGNLSVTGAVALPMEPDDYLYIGYGTQFNETEPTPYGDPSDTTFTNNQVVSVATLEYWNGEAWVELVVVDGTDVAGATFAQQGRISWTLPTDWKKNIPFSAFYSRGYWVRMYVSVALTSSFALSELRVYGVPDSLKKHRLVSALKNRIVLLDRPDAADQVDVSRELEEFGFCGAGYAWRRIGGMDAINSVVSAWDSVVIGKSESLHLLSATADGQLTVESVEAARRVPVNSQVYIKAPMGGFGDGDRYGLLFINRYGAFASTGIQADTLQATARARTLSDNYWDRKAYPHLEVDYLHLACGVYFQPKNWAVWAVPMRFAATDPMQTTNNALIVFDLSILGWLPPMRITGDVGIASMAVAYHYNAYTRGKIGDVGLYAGDYEGRILRLFDPDETTDLGAAIPGFIVQGYLNYGEPETEKEVRAARLYGKTDADAVTLAITGLRYRDNTTETETVSVDFTALTGLTEPGIDFAQPSIVANLLEYRIDFDEYTEIEALEIDIGGLRNWPPTG